MKTTLFSLLLLVTGAAHAQITVTQADFGSIGDMVVTANDTNCSATQGNAGANQVWNLATMQNNRQDTVWFISPAGTPAAADFPTANLVMKMPDGIGGYVFNYMNSTATYLDMLGSFSSGTAVKFTPAYRQMTFPSTYNTAFNGTTSFEIAFATPFPPIDSTKIKLTIDYTSLMDAWGNVTTPSGTKASLRQRVTMHQTDSTFMHNTLTNSWDWDMNPSVATDDTSFSWIGNAMNYNLANLSPVSANTPVASGAYLIYTATGIENEVLQSGIKMYPNPFNTEFTLETSIPMKDASLRIYNTLGQEVQLVNNIQGSKCSISRNHLPAGVYYMTLEQNNQLIVKRKLVIAD